MASKNIIYKVTGKPTPEQIEKFDNDEHIFYRFQNPHRKLTSRSKSWGMIYSSAKEAETDGYEVLPGKSCTDTFNSLLNWLQYYDKDYVLLIFKGYDTRVTGDDGEYVAEYNNKIAVWDYNEAIEYAQNNIWNAEEV